MAIDGCSLVHSEEKTTNQFKTTYEDWRSSLADSYHLELEGMLSWWTDTELNCDNERTSEKAEFTA